MRRGVMILLVAIAMGLFAAGAAYFWKSERAEPMNWLRAQFALDNGKAKTVERIHKEYETECALMCVRITESDEQLAKLICAGQQVTPEIQSAIMETDRLRSACRVKMLEHFYRIAAELPATKRAEYLALVLPLVLHPEEMAQSHSH